MLNQGRAYHPIVSQDEASHLREVDGLLQLSFLINIPQSLSH